jgi:hypothetical protein
VVGVTIVSQEPTQLAYQTVEPALQTARWQDMPGGFVAEIPPPPRSVEIAGASMWVAVASVILGIISILVIYIRPDVRNGWLLILFLLLAFGMWIQELRTLLRVARGPQPATALCIGNGSLTFRAGGIKRQYSSAWNWNDVLDVRLCPTRVSPPTRKSIVRLSVEMRSGEVEDVFIDSNNITWVEPIEQAMRRHLRTEISAGT